jgi:UDP-N-acetylglucosamine 2-epimerase (non-hydrolysing)
MIHCVIGTRAQLIKMAPILVEMEKREWPYSILYTGQHTDSFIELYRDFKIKTPLTSVLKSGETNTIPKMSIWLIKLAAIIVTNRIPILKDRKGHNDIVLVHGDTFSTIVGSLMSKRNGIKVGHIESGLRSFNLLHPFPEEISRLITFRLSDIAFCPSSEAHKNLSGYRHLECINTFGNTIIDALAIALSNPTKSEYPIPQESYGVISIHRFENIYNKNIFNSILKQLITIAQRYKLVFVMHPATKKRLNKTGLISLLIAEKNIELRERTGYFNFVKLLKNSTFVITDGGSNQEELDQLNIPTFLMRKTTERHEGLNKNVILGAYSATKLDQFIKALNMSNAASPTLISKPTQIILKSLEKYSS